ncbi:MAG TPA: hypothetical protein VF705_07900 [Longimicrobium sp.]
MPTRLPLTGVSALQHALPTLILQLTFALLTLAFGVMSLRVSPRPGGGMRADAWFLTGITFATIGMAAAVMGVAAFPAVPAAPGTPLRDTFVRLSPIANDARSFAVLGYTALLGQRLLGRQATLRRGRALAWLAAWLAIGAVVGALEGTWLSSVQFTVMAVLGTVTAMALFAVLYVALLRDALDWMLWSALALYAAREALCANQQLQLALEGMPGLRPQSPRPMLAAGVVSVLIMLACTVHRLSLARAGREAPGLRERLRA